MYVPRVGVRLPVPPSVPRQDTEPQEFPLGDKWIMNYYYYFYKEINKTVIMWT